MKNYNKKLMILVSMCALFMTELSYAKVRSITRRRDLEQSTTKDPMVVVFFYNDRNTDLLRMYEDVSKNQRYDDADIIFLKINAARKELSDLALMYGITNMPAFIFFYKGKRLVDERDKGIVLMGSITQDQLQSYIDQYYGTEIEQYINRKEARKEKRIEQENESWKPYFYPRDMFVPGYDPAERNLE